MKYDDASWHYGGDFPSELSSDAGATHIGMFVTWALLVDLGGSFPTGTVTFAPGETSQVITVSVSGDTEVENDECFFVELTNPSAGSITNAVALGRIINDDGVRFSCAHVELLHQVIFFSPI